jgi:hypothetical protein
MLQDLAMQLECAGFSPVNVGEVVAQQDDGHKTNGKRHRDRGQPHALPGDLSESVHAWKLV